MKMIMDGDKKWRKVKVKLEDHLKVSMFPQRLERYDECLQNYLSSISMEPLPFSKPLWDIDVINNPYKQCSRDLGL